METLQVLYREARRVRDFGFTATEYERAKADYLSALRNVIPIVTSVRTQSSAMPIVTTSWTTSLSLHWMCSIRPCR